MPSSIAPVFYDCEASSLDGYIIEIGWAYLAEDGQIVSASHLIRPAPEWRIEDAWSRKSERLHGISLVGLIENGKSVRQIAEIMNEALAGREIFSDSYYDQNWLGQLFEAAGVEMDFRISRTNAHQFIEQTAADRGYDLEKLRRAREAAEATRRHRAEADALIWAKLWRMVMQ